MSGHRGNARGNGSGNGSAPLVNAGPIGRVEPDELADLVPLPPREHWPAWLVAELDEAGIGDGVVRIAFAVAHGDWGRLLVRGNGLVVR